MAAILTHDGTVCAKSAGCAPLDHFKLKVRTLSSSAGNVALRLRRHGVPRLHGLVVVDWPRLTFPCVDCAGDPGEKAADGEERPPPDKSHGGGRR